MKKHRENVCIELKTLHCFAQFKKTLKTIFKHDDCFKTFWLHYNDS